MYECGVCGHTSEAEESICSKCNTSWGCHLSRERGRRELPDEFRLAYSFCVRFGDDKQPYRHNETIWDPVLWGTANVVYALTYYETHRNYRGGYCDEKPVYIGQTGTPLRERISKLLSATLRGSNSKGFREWIVGRCINVRAYQPGTVLLLGREVEVRFSLEAHLIDEYEPPLSFVPRPDSEGGSYFRQFPWFCSSQR